MTWNIFRFFTIPKMFFYNFVCNWRRLLSICLFFKLFFFLLHNFQRFYQTRIVGEITYLHILTFYIIFLGSVFVIINIFRTLSTKFYLIVYRDVYGSKFLVKFFTFYCVTRRVVISYVNLLTFYQNSKWKKKLSENSKHYFHVN